MGWEPGGSPASANPTEGAASAAQASCRHCRQAGRWGPPSLQSAPALAFGACQMQNTDMKVVMFTDLPCRGPSRRRRRAAAAAVAADTRRRDCEHLGRPHVAHAQPAALRGAPHGALRGRGGAVPARPRGPAGGLQGRRQLPRKVHRAAGCCHRGSGGAGGHAVRPRDRPAAGAGPAAAGHAGAGRPRPGWRVLAGAGGGSGGSGCWQGGAGQHAAQPPAPAVPLHWRCSTRCACSRWLVAAWVRFWLCACSASSARKHMVPG